MLHVCVCVLLSVVEQELLVRLGPFYKNGFTLVRALMSKQHAHACVAWNYLSFPNFNGGMVEVW